MAEIAFGLIAIPENALALARMGKFIADRIESFRDAPKFLHELQTFGYNLHHGQLHINVRLAENFMGEVVDTRLKALTRSHLDRLQEGLKKTEEILGKVVDKDGHINRLYFALKGEKNLRQNMDDLNKWQYGFAMFIILVEMSSRVLPERMLLSSDRFRTTSYLNGEYSHLLEGTSHVWLATAEVKSENGDIRDIAVLIERGDEEDQGESGVKEPVSFLAKQLPATFSFDGGILKCLGYRDRPRSELIFEVPDGMSKPRTLKSLISMGMDGTNITKTSISHRLDLGKKISEAVLRVHSAGLVHKSIRPANILTFQTASSDSSASPSTRVPFLTNWSMTKASATPSNRRGKDDWIENIYRHPQRQGLQLEKRYNMGHDIYSLGVCLLEIGLWDPLILEINEGEYTMCEAYCDMAVKLQCVELGEVNMLKKLTRPVIIHKVFTALAEQDLPRYMGPAYSNIVLRCLQCLEVGLGGFTDFKADNTAASISFLETVLQQFLDL